MQRSSAPSGLPAGAESNDDRPARWAHSIAVVVLSTLFLLGGKVYPTSLRVGFVLVVSACVFDLVRREARDPGSPVPIVAAIGVLFTIAVIIPSRYSGDLWSYAIAGRMVRFHHASPYLHAAIAFPHDPFLGLVGREWRHGTTPYGPLFTLFSTMVAFIGGGHPLLYRLAFQGSTAVVMGVGLVALWRVTRSTSVLALVGLHPVVATSVVNGGHNDAFIGVGLLLAVISARRERYVVAGWFIAGAMLVKVTAGLALVPLLVWVWFRARRRRAVAQIAAAAVGVAVPVMLLTPGMASSLDSAKTSVITRGSIWNLPYRWLLNVHDREPHITATHMVTYSLILVVVLVVGTAWLTRRSDDPVPGVVAALATWLVFSAYVLPWYTVWALPLAGLRPRHRLCWLVAVQGALITAVGVVPRQSLTGGLLTSHVVHLVVPVIVFALFVWAAMPLLRHREPELAGARTL